MPQPEVDLYLAKQVRDQDEGNYGIIASSDFDKNYGFLQIFTDGSKDPKTGRASAVKIHGQKPIARPQFREQTMVYLNQQKSATVQKSKASKQVYRGYKSGSGGQAWVGSERHRAEVHRQTSKQ